MPPKARTSANVEPCRIRILIIDDSVIDREWVARQAATMEEYECHITMAESYASASKQVVQQHFDVALVDYQLGPGNTYGDDLMRLISLAQPHCATIIVSHRMSEVSFFGARSGASAAVSKDDLNSSLLETTIRFALANKRRTRRLH